MNKPERRTERLVLRRWRHTDREPFAALNADPAVMAHFPSTLDRRASDALVDRIETNFDRDGFGLWAVEIAATGQFIGFTGLAIPHFEAHFTPAVEVGWRLAHAAWGYGYATEAGAEALAVAFKELHLPEVVSFTAEGNLRSQRVMERLGMHHDRGDDFDHPALPQGHASRHHIRDHIRAKHAYDAHCSGAE